MRIKKFTGASLREATDLMKEELGAEAIILNSRKVQKGLLNFLGKDEFEITAAVDEPAGAAPFARDLARARSEQQPDIPRPAGTLESLQNVAQAFERRTRGNRAHVGEKADKLPTGVLELKQEMESLKSVVQDIATHLKYANMPALPEFLKQTYATLVSQDVDDQLAADLVQHVYRKLGEDKLSVKQAVEQAVIQELAGRIVVQPAQGMQAKRARIIALVGPTGVGKTTTIAKLAAIHKLVHKQRVALVSADTYRIGAIEQLRTFAAIADIPMEVVYKPAELKNVLAGFRDRDVVFIDTVGRSQKAKKEIAELSRFLAVANAQEVQLVVSASTGARTIDEIITNFKPLAPNRLIFSKLDEAVTHGVVINTAAKHGLPLSFVTTGQNVPDDIRAANAQELATIIVKGGLPHA